MRGANAGLFMVIAAALLATGCHLYPRAADPAELANAQPEAPPSIKVEFQTDGRTVKTKEVVLRPNMTVQEALDETKAGKYFGRSSIDIVRAIPGQHEPLKMPIAWNNSKRRASHATNYAIYPGDRIVVTEDKSTVIDDLMSSLMGGLSAKRTANR